MPEAPLSCAQVRWALQGLQRLQRLQPRWGTHTAATAALRQEMLHFVTGLHHWSLHCILETSWRRLNQVRAGIVRCF